MDSKLIEAAIWKGVQAAFEGKHGIGTCPDERLPALKLASESGAWADELTAGRAAILAFLDAGDEKPGQGWLHDAVKDASERAGKNASVAPQLLYAPILWAMQDALSALKGEVKP